MIKLLSAGVVATILAASSFAHAQQQPATAPSTPVVAPQVPSAEDIAAFSDARIIALKTALKLKPDQEKAWGGFETTIRDVAKQRYDRVSAAMKDSQSPPKQLDLVDVMRQRATALSTSAADWKRIADATEPLYKTLDDAQKRRMIVMVAGSR
jgi:zinc resistance-associated protein